METTNTDLQSLIERARDLQDKLNQEIKKNKEENKYHSSQDHENQWFCKFSETPLILHDETQRLIGSRDSLKQVEDMLIHIQVAVNQVEESRAILMQKVSDYEGKPYSVIDELDSSFGNWSFNKKRTNCFLLCCMKFLCNPETWQRVVGGAAKLIAASITVSSTVYFCRRRHQSQCCRSIEINSHFDVYKGRG
ncbi:uncharacterized protein LOC129289820 isoform X2 [Prosopis cineraria]|uniref:uncharacterized protein LOC129289820 isoform X2 n=1 Tax=Prosopis cineraria TaxID=364024 RepID=UPI0024104D96|nr:uncharacterized protein LOC129289820 isoform X2 [Prosopis cineraria]